LVNKRMAQGGDVFRHLQAKCLTFSYRVLDARLNDKELALIDTDRIEDRASFVAVRDVKLTKLYPEEEDPAEDLARLKDYLNHEWAYFSQVFRYYATQISVVARIDDDVTNSDQKDTQKNKGFVGMDKHEFLLLAKDVMFDDDNLINACTIATKKLHEDEEEYQSNIADMADGLIQSFVNRAWEGVCASEKKAKKGVKTEAKANKDDQQLKPAMFVEALAWLANVFYEADQAAPRMPSARFQLFVEERMHTRASHNDADTFRATVRGKLVQKVFKKHRAELERVFEEYCSEGVARSDAKKPKKNAKTRSLRLSFQQFKMLLNDCNLIRKRDLTETSEQVKGLFSDEKEVEQMFFNTQKEKISGPMDNGMAQMDYGEFQEALAAMAMHDVPNPYLGLDQKLDKFIDGTILQETQEDDEE